MPRSGERGIPGNANVGRSPGRASFVIRLTLRDHVAEPANLWIRHSFSAWPSGGGDDLWCDLATGGLRPSRSGPADVSLDTDAAAELLRAATDVVYVPPLTAEHEPFRARLVAVVAETGAPLLAQVVGGRLPGAALFGPSRSCGGGSVGLRSAGSRTVGPGLPAASAMTASRMSQPTTAGLPPNATVVIDLLDSLVRQAATLREELRENRQSSLLLAPRPLQDANLVWPLVCGWTDQPEVLGPAMTRFAAAGARRVVPRVLELDARDRRLLAERFQSTWPEAFDALFHGDGSPPDAQAFRRAVEAAGIEHRLPRPLPAPPLPARLRRARELAGHLIELGDVADTHGDAYYRAARFLDRGEVDIEAAAREGNLGVLPWLEEPARQAAEQWLAARPGD